MLVAQFYVGGYTFSNYKVLTYDIIHAQFFLLSFLRLGSMIEMWCEELWCIICKCHAKNINTRDAEGGEVRFGTRKFVNYYHHTNVTLVENV
jgi:hypothetical protein